MSSAFWEMFGDAVGLALETMGEVVVVGGVEVLAIVQEAGERPEGVPGGVSGRETLALHVTQATGEGIEDGDEVEARGLSGRVQGREPHGGGWVILVGPENRWEEGL